MPPSRLNQLSFWHLLLLKLFNSNDRETMSKITSPLLTTEQAATYLGLKKNTLEKWRSSGYSPIKYVKINKRAVRYRKSELDNYLEKSCCESTLDYKFLEERSPNSPVDENFT